MRRTLKAVAGLCVLAGTMLFAGASPASAQECGGYFGPPCQEDVLEFEYPACVVAGRSFTVTGAVTPADAAAAGDDIAFDIDGTSVGDTDIDDDGTFSASLTAPNLALGDYTITGVTGQLEASGPIEVCRGGVGNNNTNNPGNGNGNFTAGNRPLARTGFDATPMVTLGAAVLILGAAAVYGSKRRRIA